MKTIIYSTVKTPFGIMGITKSDKGLCRIYFPEEVTKRDVLNDKFISVSKIVVDDPLAIEIGRASCRERV